AGNDRQFQVESETHPPNNRPRYRGQQGQLFGDRPPSTDRDPLWQWRRVRFAAMVPAFGEAGPRPPVEYPLFRCRFPVTRSRSRGLPEPKEKSDMKMQKQRGTG